MNSIIKSNNLEDNILNSLQVGMRLQLNHKNKIGKKQVIENDDSEMIGLSSFKFKKDDSLIIDDLFDENSMKKSFLVLKETEKKSKTMLEMTLNLFLVLLFLCKVFT